MNKIKKVLKWSVISVGSLIGLIIFIGIVSPSTPTEEKSVENVTASDVVVNLNNQEQAVPEVIAPIEVSVVNESNSTPAVTASNSYKVVSVVDGDTVKVSIDGKTETIRIIGLNTPETVDPRTTVECFGKEASAKAKELLSGKTVTLEADPPQGERDKYGRLLRYVFLSDGRDFGKTMIADGYAYEYTYNTSYKYQLSYKEAEATAKSQLRGLWSANTCNGLATTNTTSNATPTASSSSSAGGKYYTSSASNASKYYPEACSAWESLSKDNLKSFNSLNELLAVYPNRTLAESCK